MTLLLPIKEELVPAKVRANLVTAGFRIPHHELTLEVLKIYRSFSDASANLWESLLQPRLRCGRRFWFRVSVLDGGSCKRGVESTILSFQENEWKNCQIRVIDARSASVCVGLFAEIVQKTEAENPICPGQMFRHYAPKAKLVWGIMMSWRRAPYVIGFKERSYPLEKRILYLGSLNNEAEVAENLYRILRQLDEEGAELVWVDMNFPKGGLWTTIEERLYRAAETKF